MRIKEKGTNMQITPEIKDYLYKKLESIEKFIKSAGNDNPLCDIELGKISNHHKIGDIFRTEINLSFSGKSFRAEAEMDDLYASIDIARDELVHALQSRKTKEESLLRRGGSRIKSLIKGFFGRE